jgi:hypothetical protein
VRETDRAHGKISVAPYKKRSIPHLNMSVPVGSVNPTKSYPGVVSIIYAKSDSYIKIPLIFTPGRSKCL